MLLASLPSFPSRLMPSEPDMGLRLKQAAAKSPIDLGAFMVPDDLLNPEKPNATRSLAGDDVIDLDCGLGPANIKAHLRRVNLGTIEDPGEREVVRAAIFMGMNYDHDVDMPWRLGKIAPASTPYFVERIRSLLRWVEDRGLSLSNISQGVLGDWLEDRKSEVSPSTVLHEVIVWRRLWAYRDSLPISMFTFPPWGSRSSAAVSEYRAPEENKTPRIPVEIYAPMLRWALFYIEAGAHDLLLLRKAIPRDDEKINRAPTWVLDAKIARFVQRVENGEAVITCHADGSLHRRAIAADVGATVNALAYRGEFDHFEELAQRHGKTVLTAHFQWSELPGTGVAWCGEITGRESFRLLQDMLAACYLVIALLSGMRDSEVTALRRGQLKVLRDENGDPYRYLIEATIFKGRDKIEGEPHVWVVPKVVADAVAVAESVQDHLNHIRDATPTEREADLLFLRPSVQAGGVASFTEGTANDFVRALARRCNEFAIAAAERTDDASARQRILDLYLIPNDVSTGVNWKWATRQYRRTLAWFIANRPFGVVAGSLQYGHLGSLVFEGYAGTSQSGFPDEVEAELFLGRQHDIIALYEDYASGIPIGGPRGPLLEAEFREFDRELGAELADMQGILDPLPGQIIDDVRRKKLLGSIAANLHPGFVNDCFYYAPHALCNSDKNSTSPIWERCRPLKCPNSCVSQKYVPILMDMIADTEKMKKDIKLPLQKKVLDNQINRYTNLVQSAARGRSLEVME